MDTTEIIRKPKKKYLFILNFKERNYLKVGGKVSGGFVYISKCFSADDGMLHLLAIKQKINHFGFEMDEAYCKNTNSNP